MTTLLLILYWLVVALGCVGMGFILLIGAAICFVAGYDLWQSLFSNPRPSTPNTRHTHDQNPHP